MKGRAPAATALWVAVASAAAGCTGPGAGPPLPGRPATITVTMDEYRFSRLPAVPGGRVVFRFVNAGDRVHQPDLVPLPKDLPPIDEQLRGETRTAVAPFAGIPPRRPGDSGAFAVDLVAGQRYAIVCFARGADDEPHAVKGMSTEFVAGGPKK